jgi:hypothetical protein
MNAEIAVYTLLAVSIVLGIFFGALMFVNAARKGNRQFKWSRTDRSRGKM